MDFDSSSKFIASLAKFLQSLCNGYVDFDKGVEVIGHIYINVDSDTGKKVDYVLNEKVCKNDNSITFISNSFHAQPAEKPKPPVKKAAEPEKEDEESIVMNDTGHSVPNSTNVGTLGTYRSSSSRAGMQDAYAVGSKRPRTPPQIRNNKVESPVTSKHGTSQLQRYQDSGGSAAKMSRSDIPQSPMNSSAHISGRGDYGADDDGDNYSSNYLDDQNSSELEQKPVIDPDISIVKEEFLSNQSSCSYSGSGQTSGPGRGKSQASSAYPVMLHQSPSTYASASPASHQPEMYSGSSLEGSGDPSTTCHSVSSLSRLLHGKQKPFSGSIKRRRSTLANQSYTEEEKEEMCNYALVYGSTAAARHFSQVYAKRIPRESVKNFVAVVRNKMQK